ncbi:secreted protein, putative [Ixodes scapularis]|uniref:Secreted protein, putative n=1 Tax=Ixodes scapularis TaxID=6945 RepID=B7Q6E1_IXOSC|nr:secreted protein, putative [Ixodes scapularis]|eukprot:XP_002402928.1 secreted protein, putative [Ixodes scapularis]
MAFLATFLTLLCFNLVLTEDLPKPEHCDVPDKAQLEDKLDKLIRNLPKEHVANQTKVEILPRAIFLGEGTLHGLDHLEQDRPYKTFCRGKDTVTVFSVSPRFEMRMRIPWSLCSGHNGTIISHALFVRYEGELVTTKTDSGTEYRIKNVIPVVMEGLFIAMDGGGDIVYAISSGLGYILSGLLRVLWVQGITPFVEDAFQQALNELN